MLRTWTSRQANINSCYVYSHCVNYLFLSRYSLVSKLFYNNWECKILFYLIDNLYKSPIFIHTHTYITVVILDIFMAIPTTKHMTIIYTCSTLGDFDSRCLLLLLRLGVNLKICVFIYLFSKYVIFLLTLKIQ